MAAEGRFGKIENFSQIADFDKSHGEKISSRAA
jgi:hypothetical protein